MARLIPALLACALAVDGGWIIEQKMQRGPRRIVAGNSAWKDSQDDYDIILNFASSEAYIVDQREKTISKTSVAELTRRYQAAAANNPETRGPVGKSAGLDCVVFRSSSSSGSRAPGGWSNQEGCVTDAIKIDPRYQRDLDAWLRASDPFGSHGLTLMLRVGVDGPLRDTVTTMKAVQADVPASEFIPPKNYKPIPFN